MTELKARLRVGSEQVPAGTDQSEKDSGLTSKSTNVDQSESSNDTSHARMFCARANYTCRGSVKLTAPLCNRFNDLGASKRLRCKVFLLGRAKL